MYLGGSAVIGLIGRLVGQHEDFRRARQIAAVRAVTADFQGVASGGVRAAGAITSVRGEEPSPDHLND